MLAAATAFGAGMVRARALAPACNVEQCCRRRWRSAARLRSFLVSSSPDAGITHSDRAAFSRWSISIAPDRSCSAAVTSSHYYVVRDPHSDRDDRSGRAMGRHRHSRPLFPSRHTSAPRRTPPRSGHSSHSHLSRRIPANTAACQCSSLAPHTTHAPLLAGLDAAVVGLLAAALIVRSASAPSTS